MRRNNRFFTSKRRSETSSPREGATRDSRGRGVHDSFYIGNDHVKLDGKRIWIPKLGWVRMREELRFRGRLVSATVSRTADQWFVSLSVELEQIPQRCESQAAIALEDLNVKGMLSNRYLARAIADIGFYELRRQLEYKAALKGNHIEVADRWFPSSEDVLVVRRGEGRASFERTELPV